MAMEKAKAIAALRRQLKSVSNETAKKALTKKIERLKSELEAEKTPTKQLAMQLSKARTEINAMSKSDFNAMIKKLAMKPEYSFLKGMTKQEIKDDLDREAKPVGWRFRGRDNFKKPTKADIKQGKKVYYENRPNRSDVIHPAKLANGGGVGDEISLAIKYGKMLNDLNKEKQFNKKIELNSALKNFEKQNEISIDSNNVISVKGNKVAYIDKINAKTGQPKTNWDIKKYANGGKTDFGMLSVKAGIDNNPNPTYADKIAGAKMKKMAFGGMVYDLSYDAIDRMEGLAPISAMQVLNNNVIKIYNSLEEEGFEKDEIASYLSYKTVQYLNKMTRGGSIEVGDKVKASKEYGGKSGTVIEKRGSFVVVEDSKGKTQSYHESDLVKKYANGGGIDMLHEDDFVWNALGKKLVVDKVTDDEYWLSGFMQPSASPFSKEKVHSYLKKGEWSLNPKMAEGGGVDDYTKSLGMVKVKFADSKYNYETSVSGSLTEKDVRDYFVGKSFNVGTYPKEIFEKVVDIEFFPKGTYAEGGMMDANEENRDMVMNNNIQIMHHTHELKEAVKKAKYIPAWVVAKVFEATSALSNVTHYLDGTTKMAKGGGVGNHYEGKSYNEIWDSWTSKQRQHFVEDHLIEFMDVANTWSGKDAFVPEIITYKAKDLPYRVYNSLVSHVKSGQYATGGGVDVVKEGDIVLWDNKKYKVGKEDKDISNFYLLNMDGTYAENPNGSLLKVHKSRLKKMERGGGINDSGLMVIGKTTLDNNSIGDVVEEEGYYAEWNAREGYWFFPEEIDMYDNLEMELDKHFAKRGINARFEGVFGKGGLLKGNQHKLDMNKNGRLDAEDFKILRGKK